MYIKPYRVYHNRPTQKRTFETEVHVPLDVKVEDDAYVVDLVLPGLTPDDVDIQIVEKTIEISGEFVSDNAEDTRYLRRERPAGKFRRVIRLPKLLDMAKSEANLQNGILRLRVPVAEEALPRTIKVKAK
jgi:HSP20 family protein